MDYMSISGCGLKCNECDIFKLPKDIEIQNKMLPYYRSQGWLKENEGIEVVIEKGMYCKGCNVDKKAFWSDGCKIAICSKDNRKLNNCSECSDFPCDILNEHANKEGKYREGVNLLISLKHKEKVDRSNF